jgi:dimethylhistidine N-methyltransferase
MTAPRPLAGADAALRDEVLAGLRADRKTLHPKLFYDAAGAALFERITTLPEYYPTRTELAILRACAPEMAALAGPRAALVEYGSGAGAKVRPAARRLRRGRHAGGGIRADRHLARAAGVRGRRAGGGLSGRARASRVRRLHGGGAHPDLPQRARRVAFFPGSTIGNFHPTEAAAFLRRVRRTVAADGALVLGIDRRKDARVLQAAYDDAAGVTAAFNLNLLTRLNRELGADFDLARFRHRAVWNDRASRVEMHLESVGAAGGARRRRDDHVRARGDGVDGVVVQVRPAAARPAGGRGGLRVARLWTDAAERFWVAFLTVAPGRG